MKSVLFIQQRNKKKGAFLKKTTNYREDAPYINGAEHTAGINPQYPAGFNYLNPSSGSG